MPDQERRDDSGGVRDGRPDSLSARPTYTGGTWTEQGPGQAENGTGNGGWREAWDRAGLASGHAWARCDICGAEAMTVRASNRRCSMTHGCRGTLRAQPDRPTPLQALKAGLVTPIDIVRHPPAIGATLRRLAVKLSGAEASEERAVAPPNATPSPRTSGDATDGA